MTNALTLHSTRNNLASNIWMERSSPENMKQYIWEHCFQIVQITNVIGWKCFGTKLVPPSSGKSVFLIQSWKAKYYIELTTSDKDEINAFQMKFATNSQDSAHIYWPCIHESECLWNSQKQFWLWSWTLLQYMVKEQVETFWPHFENKSRRSAATSAVWIQFLHAPHRTSKTRKTSNFLATTILQRCFWDNRMQWRIWLQQPRAPKLCNHKRTQ